MLKALRVVCWIGVAFSAFLFGSQNTDLVNINLLVVSQKTPLAAVIGVSIVIGIAIGFAIASQLIAHLKVKHWQLKRSYRNLASNRGK